MNIGLSEVTWSTLESVGVRRQPVQHLDTARVKKVLDAHVAHLKVDNTPSKSDIHYIDRKQWKQICTDIQGFYKAWVGNGNPRVGLVLALPASISLLTSTDHSQVRILRQEPDRPIPCETGATSRRPNPLLPVVHDIYEIKHCLSNESSRCCEGAVNQSCGAQRRCDSHWSC